VGCGCDGDDDDIVDCVIASLLLVLDGSFNVCAGSGLLVPLWPTSMDDCDDVDDAMDVALFVVDVDGASPADVPGGSPECPPLFPEANPATVPFRRRFWKAFLESI